ncbi:hypothetical protein Glo7428_4887 (plasmid) [Gloeocapsa sp. PCC 7428]|uniref:hypothetical protein n=1 Tax=Gloeocapsa sp. PCC 7428 TaxID=1173026 RepID=UPI0002A5F9CD|nr:hypothetical protein [Gloeocapsa sp. PCC 7428]AFZ33311.1 hypothetical protein Glo7428_4887 [Gloeocapsa sp. PCC 7428]
MVVMGKYCKAYLVKQLRQFKQWSETSKNDEEHQLNGDDVVYLQENYVVTNGIFKDENIIFDNITQEWQDFCHAVLQFEPDSAKVATEE